MLGKISYVVYFEINIIKIELYLLKKMNFQSIQDKELKRAYKLN